MRKEKPGLNGSKTNYSLGLAGGHKWVLMATADEKTLLEKIAFVMKLDNGSADDAPRLILT